MLKVKKPVLVDIFRAIGDTEEKTCIGGKFFMAKPKPYYQLKVFDRIWHALLEAV